jgi:NADPH:quinone reductase-like Zn-dependent oxidoreductase
MNALAERGLAHGSAPPPRILRRVRSVAQGRSSRNKGQGKHYRICNDLACERLYHSLHSCKYRRYYVASCGGFGRTPAIYDDMAHQLRDGCSPQPHLKNIHTLPTKESNMVNMHAWQFKTATGGLENNLYQPAAGVPKPKIAENQILIEVYSAALNPADYKVPELGLLARGMVPSPSIPGMDFCGKVCEAGREAAAYRVGEMVFGMYGGPLGHGSLGQYIVVSKEMLATVPTGLKVDDMAGVAVAGLTAYQSIQPYVKEGDKVFINGGSGGTGIFCIQIAKALGCHVTTTCSTANIELCQSLGADEVIDYKSVDVVETLKKKGQIFSLIVDNVGMPSNLYGQCHHFVVHHGHYSQVGSDTSISSALQLVGNMLLPGLLGGGRRKYQFLMLKPNHNQLVQLGRWIDEGKVKPVIDSLWEYDDTPRAFERLKTQRAKGKVIVHVKKNLLME